MADEIFMDVEAVKKVANTFTQINDNLKKVSNTMQVTITMLKASSFVGLFSNQVLAAQMEALKAKIDAYSQKCDELSGDLVKSADAYQNGDAAGAQRFH